MGDSCLESVPKKFLDYLQEAIYSAGLGDAQYNTVVKALFESEPPISIRFNKNKQVETDFEALFDGAVPWCPSAVYLSKRPSFTHDPLFHAGAYYVQEASSMFLEVLAPILSDYGDNLSLLDTCAAPGGKSTHLASIMGKGSQLLCNEVVSNRAGVLKENIAKWGNPAVTVTSRRCADLYSEGEQFDLILVDAPCSGEGMFRKDRRAMKDWSEKGIEICASRQREILSDIWEALKPGGILLYSTCTFNIIENDGNLLWLKDRYGATIFSPISDADVERWGIVRTASGGFQFFPGLVRGEGFFISFLKKGGDYIRGGDIGKKKRGCTIKRGYEERSLKPSQEYATSILYNHEWDSVELSRQEALAYLSKETITLHGYPRGIMRVTYKGLGLGFVNNIGSRANNLYPTGWRIRNRQ